MGEILSAQNMKVLLFLFSFASPALVKRAEWGDSTDYMDFASYEPIVPMDPMQADDRMRDALMTGRFCSMFDRLSEILFFSNRC